jgi:hypothetical protein
MPPLSDADVAACHMEMNAELALFGNAFDSFDKRFKVSGVLMEMPKRE